MNQPSLFELKGEKGSAEWSAFNPVKHDSVGMFRVLTPRKAEEPRYSNVIRIRRYQQPHQIFLKSA